MPRVKPSCPVCRRRVKPFSPRSIHSYYNGVPRWFHVSCWNQRERRIMGEPEPRR